ncbi:N-acetyltransferase [Achromobacter sp.]|uniref:N-acetyltransferase n=1 Tax=Achromobacter sp. TaxID=134375 RepID=UPI00257BFEF8|nr:N-acetyltransferase [Achromobacter sp.]
MLPSLERSSLRDPYGVPRIHLLEVRHRTAPEHNLAWILVEVIEERVTIEGRAHDATLRLQCQPVSPTYPPPAGAFTFVARYWQHMSAIKLTGTSLDGGAVFVDPGELRGHRVGTYLMDLIVNWARQWPEATVQPIKLLADQGRGAAGARRNRFYEQFGLRFAYTSNEKLAGESLPMPAGDLVQCRSWEQNIRIHEVPTLLAHQFATENASNEEIRQLRNVQSDLMNERKQAEARPFIWLYHQRRPLIDGCAIAALVALVAWKPLAAMF